MKRGIIDQRDGLKRDLTSPRGGEGNKSIATRFSNPDPIQNLLSRYLKLLNHIITPFPIFDQAAKFIIYDAVVGPKRQQNVPSHLGNIRIALKQEGVYSPT